MNRATHYLRNPDDYYALGAKKVCSRSGLRRVFFVVFGLQFLVLLSFENSAFANTTGASTRPELATAGAAALVTDLASDDSAVREGAATRLIALGAAARPQVLRAVQTDDPGLREQAAQVLLALPWSVPSDPLPVKNVLDGYGSPEIMIRRDKVVSLLSVPNGAGVPVLWRLLREDPSPEIRWTIVRCLRVSERQASLQLFRTLEPDANDPQTNALCGYARWSLQLSGATNYLKRCAELEFSHPTDDGGEFDSVIQLLVESDLQQKNYVEAADWRRREFARGSPLDEDGIPSALLELFALQASYGPLPGLQDDLNRAVDFTSQPKILYCLAQLRQRQGQPDQAAKQFDAAFNASVTRQERYEVAKFLLDHGWNDQAEKEDRKFLQMETPHNGEDFRFLDEDVHFQLASLAAIRGDDETAGHEQETAMRLSGDDSPLTRIDEQGHEFPTPASEMWAEIHWHYFRAAEAHHDDARAENQLQQILSLKPTDSSIAIDLVPQLKATHRPTEAAVLFSAAYNDLKSRLDSDPADPDTLNAIAWVCGNCGEHLAEAEKWATAAVAATPGNAAVIDTLATVNYAEGKYAEAVILETRASSIDPSDAFMQGQLEKFKKAAGSSK